MSFSPFNGEACEVVTSKVFTIKRADRRASISSERISPSPTFSLLTNRVRQQTVAASRNQDGHSLQQGSPECRAYVLTHRRPTFQNKLLHMCKCNTMPVLDVLCNFVVSLRNIIKLCPNVFCGSVVTLHYTKTTYHDIFDIFLPHGDSTAG